MNPMHNKLWNASMLLVNIILLVDVSAAMDVAGCPQPFSKHQFSKSSFSQRQAEGDFGRVPYISQRDSPVVGIFAEDNYKHNLIKYGSQRLVSSYVRFLESAGARVVPVFMNQTIKYYEELYTMLNGILLPGGGIILGNGDYYNVSKYFLKRSKDDFDRSGEIFPIVGICMGMEDILYIIEAESQVNNHTNGTFEVSMPLEFTGKAHSSRFFSNMPPAVLNTLSTLPVTANSHKMSCLLSTFERSVYLKKILNVLSTNRDESGHKFVSTAEGITYPIYLIQWHPEKNSYEFGMSYIDHSTAGKIAMNYIANFLVDQYRLSSHESVSKQQLEAHLIYNYNATYTGKTDKEYETTYFFF